MSSVDRVRDDKLPAEASNYSYETVVEGSAGVNVRQPQ